MLMYGNHLAHMNDTFNLLQVRIYGRTPIVGLEWHLFLECDVLLTIKANVHIILKQYTLIVGLRIGGSRLGL